MFSSSPRLIAAGHVLHRRLAPRHPPSALSSLTTIYFGLNALMRLHYISSLIVKEQSQLVLTVLSVKC